MYKNEPTSYGCKMTFGGYIDVDLMEEWASEGQQEFDLIPDKWHCHVDMLDMDWMAEESQGLMSDMKCEWHENGLIPIATLMEPSKVCLQFEQISEGPAATKSGISTYSRWMTQSGRLSTEFKSASIWRYT